jgi:hypothetical protein
MYLIRAHTPGTGKSYMVDIIAAIATGRICPVITASYSEEEIEKRLGSVVLSGAALISIDNCTRDLEGLDVFEPPTGGHRYTSRVRSTLFSGRTASSWRFRPHPQFSRPRRPSVPPPL